ncbi:histidine kinase [Diaphorobacter sp. HDW4A]|uniref:MHYT domain-containing protein n=1 Tax=Diaphorobacter sp. HDW4A TaxID=2714924 RepID=UPI00140AFBA3|nr:MHYT domain-containing protein [Diaphorobacter sp. HDW4A]QIL79244.1 histidine kinase [Diaphorobacter sp. HDW4A]
MNDLLGSGELLLHPTYELGMVALSYCISVIGAFVALTAAQYIRHGRQINWLNLLSAGTALGGIGVWSMHFTGMLALNLGMASGYSAFETVISLIAAITATSLALAYVAKDAKNNTRVLTAGGLLGLGVAVMHYLGMFGMRFPGYIMWSWGIIAISVVIAMAAASAALWLAFRTKSMGMRGVAAAVMGIAVCSMHYTGMAAADFVCTSVSQRFATPQGLLVFSSMQLPLLTAIAAIGMAVLIGYDQLLQRNFGSRKAQRA